MEVSITFVMKSYNKLVYLDESPISLLLYVF